MSTLRAAHPYTATDHATGITADSLTAWRASRDLFSEFVRADIAAPNGSAGAPYADTGGRPVHPSFVLIDDRGRTLALNGVSCGYRGEGPRGAALILSTEGLLTVGEAEDVLAGGVFLAVRAVSAPADSVGPAR